MHTTRRSESETAEVLIPMRARWAVLAAMLTDLLGHGISLPQGLRQELAVTRMTIGSGSFSRGEPQRRLARLEGRLVSVAFALGTDYLDGWFDLLRQAACGEITEDDLRNFPRPRREEAECPVHQVRFSAAA